MRGIGSIARYSSGEIESVLDFAYKINARAKKAEAEVMRLQEIVDELQAELLAVE